MSALIEWVGGFPCRGQEAPQRALGVEFHSGQRAVNARSPRAGTRIISRVPQRSLRLLAQFFNHRRGR